MFAKTSYAMLTALLCAPAAAFADAAPEIECRCRAPDGERRDLGTVACVRIGQGDYLVRCEMSTNTPYWRRLDDAPGCPQPS